MFLLTAAVAAIVSVASAQTTSYVPNTSTNTAAVASELATALPLSPVSHVPGKVFDRIAIIMMENTDFVTAAADENFQALAALGITLTNYYGTTHPSEPQYCAIHGGDNFGMDNDDFNQIPYNVSTLWDLLAEKDISFGEYQEDLPYPGFEGYEYLNPDNGANNYVRKHNPAVLYNKNVQDPTRLNTIKSFVNFEADLIADALPQYMYITPNMLNDAHDTDILYGGDWLFQWLEPLLDDPHFMNNTLVWINFDEDETYTISNRVMSVVISDKMPKSLINTTDDNFYDHYSVLATIEANWDLHHLGRWDTHANVLSYVANTTGDVLRPVDVPYGQFFLNQSYPGAMSATVWGPLPVPNISATVNGRSAYPPLIEAWSDIQECGYYTDQVVPPDGLRLPKVIPTSCWTLGPNPTGTGSGSSTSTSSGTSATTTSATSSQSSTTSTTTTASSSSSTEQSTSTTSTTQQQSSTLTSTSQTTTSTPAPYTTTIYETTTVTETTTACPSPWQGHGNGNGQGQGQGKGNGQGQGQGKGWSA